MSIFPETVKAYMAGAQVKHAFLASFDFLTEATRVWMGNGVLESDGELWYGVGTLASIGNLKQALAGKAPETTFTLSGLDPDIVQLARAEWDTEAKNRKATVYIQFFNSENDRLLDGYDAPYPVWQGIMKTPSFAISRTEAQITVSAESIFSLRSRPNYSMYTDRDQKRRYPGDEGFEFVADLVDKVVQWPVF